MIHTKTMRTSGFTAEMVRRNRLDRHGFGRWMFRPGMRFGDTAKWWDTGRRPTPHEGVDLCCYADAAGNIRHLKEMTAVPAIYDGTVVRLMDDFLGKTVVLAHPETGSPEKALLTFYAHTVPDDALYLGKWLREGDVLARIAGTKRLPPGMTPHIHLSAGRLMNGVALDMLDWKKISRREAVVLADPLSLIALVETPS